MSTSTKQNSNGEKSTEVSFERKNKTSSYQIKINTKQDIENESEKEDFQSTKETNIYNLCNQNRKNKITNTKKTSSSSMIEQMNSFITNYDELVKMIVKQRAETKKKSLKANQSPVNQSISKLIESKKVSKEIIIKDSPLKNWIALEIEEEEGFKLVEVKSKKSSSKRNSVEHLVSSIQKSPKARKKGQELREFYQYSKDCLSAIRDLTKPSEAEISELMVDLPLTEEELIEKKVAIFDLDETLVHCEAKEVNAAQVSLDVTMPSGQNCKIGINIRPFAVESLKEISKHYYLIVFTASHPNYADTVLNYLDPQQSLFKMRLYRNNCVKVFMEEDFVYVKDLRVIRNLDLSRVVIIDNSILSFSFHLSNGIPILPYHDSHSDNELRYLVKYLRYLSKCKDVREENSRNFDLDNFLNRGSDSHSDSSSDTSSGDEGN